MRRLMFAASAAIALDISGPAAMAAVQLQRLAIYYGYPSLVEDSRGDIARAASVFARYDVVVFGDGLELPEAEVPGGNDAGMRAERQKTGPIIRAIRALATATHRPAVYGYVDLGSTQHLSSDDIERRVDAWRRVGADGVFFDEAGKDFGVTSERRRAAVCAAHVRGLSAFMNAFNPDDLFDGDVAGRAADCGRLGTRDALLLESFAVRNGEFEAASRIEARAAAALKWRERAGVRVYAVTTTDGRPFSLEEFNSARQHAASRALDGFGWGEKNFSVDSRLPWRGQP